MLAFRRKLKRNYTELAALALLGEGDENRAPFDEFLNAQTHNSINGFMYCNGPVPTIVAGSKVRIHVMALGDQTDMHTPRLGE